MEPTRVLITGTTSGIGRALVEYYAERGSQVIAVNRSPLPQDLRRWPTVREECVDVRSSEAVGELVGRLACAGELPEIFLLNAGINRVDNDERFHLETYRDVMETNLFGVLNFVDLILRWAPPGKTRRIVAVSSMTTYVGNPYALGYQVSKRALSRCFDVWSDMYRGSELHFKQVLLGPVTTPMFTMSSLLPGWMGRLREGLSVSSDASARRIAAFAMSRGRKLHWPCRAVVLFLAMGVLRALLPGFFRGRRTLSGGSRRERSHLPDSVVPRDALAKRAQEGET